MAYKCNIPKADYAKVELALIISYPTSTSGVIILLKTPQKITRKLIIFVEHGIYMAHIMAYITPDNEKCV